MPTAFPPAGQDDDPATYPRRTPRATPAGEGGGLRRAALVPAAIALIAAGVVLVWIVTGTVAGVDTDAIGIGALALGGIALMARLVAQRQSHDRHGPSLP